MKKLKSSTFNATSKSKENVMAKKNKLTPSSNNKKLDLEENNKWHSLLSLKESKETETNNLNIDKLILKD